MVDRWWDPDGPSVALLDPAGDPQLEVANALVQIHRSGAAALQVAAHTPLVDDTTVALSMMQAREAYAEPVQALVGRALGDDIYAELFVRDVSDEADATAMQLYHACVSKDVSPPVAVERAAAVYGVPPADLGRYAQLAADPKTNQVTLTDAADRALFGWMARASADEIENVSKRESPERRRAAAAKETRGTEGRWVATEARAPITVAGQPVEDWLNAQLRTTGPAEVATEAKPQGKLRKVQRRGRRGKRRVETAPTIRKTTVARTTIKRTTVQAKKLQRILLAETKKILTPSPNLSRIERQPPADMHTIHGPVTGQYLGHDTAFVLPYDEWRPFSRAAVNSKNMTVFTGDALNKYVGVGSPVDSPEHIDHAQGVVELIRKDPKSHFKGAGPDQVMDVSPEDEAKLLQVYDRSDAGEYHHLLDSLKREYLRQYLDDEGFDESAVDMAREIGNITAVPDHDDPDTLVFVWHSPRTDGNQRLGRPRVSIAEAIVDEEGARGYTQTTTSHGAEDVVLDPNLPLIYRGRPGDAEQFTTYDRNLGAYRTQINIDVTDPGNVSKAESPQARRDAIAEETRGESGRWVRMIDGRPADDWLNEQIRTGALAPARKAQRRGRRGVRGAPPAKTAVRSATMRRTTISPAQLQRAKVRIAQVREAVPDTENTTLPVHDQGEYTIIDRSDMKRRLAVSANTHDKVLDGDQTNWLRGQSVHAGNDIYSAIMDRADTADYLQEMPSEQQYEASSAGLAALQKRVAHVLKPGTLLELQMQRVRHMDGSYGIRAEFAPKTLADAEAIHVLSWSRTSAEYNHELTWHGSKAMLTPAQIELQISVEWHAVLDAETDTLADSVSVIHNPKIDFWEINDADPSR